MFLIQEEKSKLRNKFSFIERATQVLIFSSSFKDKAVCALKAFISGIEIDIYENHDIIKIFLDIVVIMVNLKQSHNCCLPPR